MIKAYLFTMVVLWIANLFGVAGIKADEPRPPLSKSQLGFILLGRLALVVWTLYLVWNL